ncbi:hypothetical protein O0L34_g7883 [Tuta absoluta]|nr:hypothetical protein O0L34_g7883 [Tuta absoluta]
MKAVIVMVLCGAALTMARPQDRELNQYQVGGGNVVDGPVSDVNVVDGPGQAPSDVNVVNGPGGHPGARSARQVGPNNGWQPAYNQERNPNISIEPEYVDFGNNYPVNPNYPGHLRPGQSPPGARSG